MEIRQAFFPAEFRTWEDIDRLSLEGYFVVYNQRTELWPRFFEEIAPEALRNATAGNVIALFNHNTDIVLGATANGTLELQNDTAGLYGMIHINREDTEAVNIYQRVKRGDIAGCSFGFRVNGEEFIEGENGSIISRITDVELLEVSVCPFPAYPQTSIQARRKAFEDSQRRAIDAKREALRRRLHHGAQIP